MLPAFSRGVRYAHRSLDIRRRLGDVWGQGQSLGFAGVVLYAASQYDSGAGACRQAIGLLERTGDRWEVNTAGWNLAMCLHRQGELVEAAETAQRVFLAAQAIGDAASGISLSVWTKAMGGRIDPDLIRAELARGGEDAHTACELHLADAVRLLHDGAVAQAVSQLAAGITIVGRAGLRQEYIAPVFPWYATALRRLAETTPGHNPPCGPPGCATPTLPYAAPGVGLELSEQPAARPARGRPGGVAARPPAPGEAPADPQRRERREAGCALRAGAFPARPRRAVLRRWGYSGGSRGRTYRCARLRGPSAAPAGETVAPPMSVFDRFTTLLEVGRTITAATSPQAVDAAVGEAALTLLRGERCHLLGIEALTGNNLTTRSGESVDEVSERCWPGPSAAANRSSRAGRRQTRARACSCPDYGRCWPRPSPSMASRSPAST